MRKRCVPITVISVVILASTLFLFSGQAMAKKFQWKLFDYMSPQVAQNYAGWVNDIRKQTDGNLDIKIFYDGEHPFKPADLLTALKDRSCDMAAVTSSYTAGSEPLLTAFELPMMAVNTQSHVYVFNHIREKWYDPVLEKKYNQKLLLWEYYPGQAINVRDTFLNDFDSLKGKKIRVYSKETATWATLLNAAPVTIPWAEVYMAAQRGIIDGSTGALGVVYDSKWYEVFKYITVTDFIMSVAGIHVNLDAWKELPPEYQKVVLETAKTWQAKYWNNRETDNYKKMALTQQLYNCRVRYMDPGFRQKLVTLSKEKLWPDWVQRSGDPIKANNYIKECEKYRDEFMSMSTKDKVGWLKQNGFPVELIQ